MGYHVGGLCLPCLDSFPKVQESEPVRCELDTNLEMGKREPRLKNRLDDTELLACLASFPQFLTGVVEKGALRVIPSPKQTVCAV